MARRLNKDDKWWFLVMALIAVLGYVAGIALALLVRL
jgi:hypothetical protein